MELSKGIIAQDLFLYLPEYRTFIVSDIHIGYEESLNRRGILVPRYNYNDLLLRLEKSLENIKKRYNIDTIIINGDIVHEFGKINRKEKELINRFVNFLCKYGKVMIIEGNHDKALRYVLDRDILIADKIILGKTLIIHGDELLPRKLLKSIKTIIIGHEHPAITLGSGSRTEKYKCFLKGKYSGKELIVTPSCNLLIEGTDILSERVLSPFLKNVSLKNFEVYIVEDKVYDFGKIKNIEKILDNR
jgi:hypothetical protein